MISLARLEQLTGISASEWPAELSLGEAEFQGVVSKEAAVAALVATL